MRIRGVLVTCEHASARVPKFLSRAFSSRGAQRRLATHEGSDLGAQDLARRLAQRLRSVPQLVVVGPIDGKVSRLIVDLNRSLHHPRLFSDVTRALPLADRRHLLDEYYVPHQRAVRAALDSLARGAGPTLHLGVHSFTPELRGEIRNADVGLLYDPRRKGELEFADRLHAALSRVDSDLRVRRNYPYRGTADGLTTALRKERRASRYVGIELELHQAAFARREFASRVVTAVELAITAA